MEDITKSSNQVQFSRHPRNEYHVEDSGDKAHTLLAGKILYEKAVEAALHQEFSYWRSQFHSEGNVDESSMIHALKTAELRSAYCSSLASSGTVHQDALAGAVETRPPGDGFVFHERYLMDKVHSMVLQEVLKDIEIACNLLNISPGEMVTLTNSNKHCYPSQHYYPRQRRGYCIRVRLFVCLFVRTELSCFTPQLLVGLRRNFHHWCNYLCRMF